VPAHRDQLPLGAVAIAMGGHVRVGLEDNIYYAKGRLARNDELVARIARIAEELGRPVAAPDEARRLLGIPHGPKSAGAGGIGGHAAPIARGNRPVAL
jgi:3-keto-5-aminohexanoate cleavage enzyme